MYEKQTFSDDKGIFGHERGVDDSTVALVEYHGVFVSLYWITVARP